MAYRDDVLGDDVLGDSYYGGRGFHVIGEEEVHKAAKVLMKAAEGDQATAQARRAARMVMIPGQRPEWRDRLAPGVPTPGTKLYPLALTPSANNGVFNPATSAIEWTARPQKPFRGERLVAIVSRVGAAGIIPVATIFVGTDLVQASAGGLPLETFAPGAFGVRMAWPQAEPGIEIRVAATLIGGPIAVGDSIAVSLMVLGETEA